jgi:hypothetical protein
MDKDKLKLLASFFARCAFDKLRTYALMWGLDFIYLYFSGTIKRYK